MGVLEIVLIVAALLCSLVAGLVFAFAIVVMPGIRNLEDREFIRAFQVIDRVIQNNHPLFMLVWIGSTLTLFLAAGIGVAELTGLQRVTLILAAILYATCVQLPTVLINIPLNNALQKIDVASLGEDEARIVRADFESPWNRWNSIRTAFACLVTLLQLIVLLAHRVP